jgi:hypothetical protein
VNKGDKIFSKSTNFQVNIVSNRKNGHKFFRAAITEPKSPWNQDDTVLPRGLKAPNISLRENQTGFGGEWTEDLKLELRIGTLEIQLANSQGQRLHPRLPGSFWKVANLHSLTSRSRRR